MVSAEYQNQKLQSLRFEALYQLTQMDPSDLKAIKAFALDAAILTTQSQIGYIYFLNDDATTLTLQAWSDSILGECKAGEPCSEFPLASTGLCGESVRQRKPVIINDPRGVTSGANVLSLGQTTVTRYMSLPVFDQGRIVLVAGVANKHDSYDDEDIRHLTLLMEGLWSILVRNQATAELLRNEQTLRSVYESSPANYQSLDNEGRFRDVNPAWVDTFGYSRKEILGRKFSDLLTEASQALVAERFPVLLEQGKISNADFEVIHKAGHILLITLDGRVTFDDKGAFLYTNCILTDVTEARSAEAQLRQSEEAYRLVSLQFQSLLDSIPDRIQMLDRELRVIWTNQKETPLGESFLSDPAGCICYEIMHGRTQPCEDCPAIKAFISGQVEQHERLNPDGRTWEQRAFPVHNQWGEVINVVEIGQDISKKIKLREEIGRTAQLASIGELSAGVAHEINNPINGVVNYAQLLKNSFSPGTREHDISERIIKEGDRVAGIVRQLLFLSRDEKSGHQPLNLCDVLSDTLSLVSCQFNNEGIDLEVKLADELPLMQGHAQHLQQLFLNILSNARYALNERFPETNPNKRVEVEICPAMGDNGPELLVRFYDRGTGIPAELLDKVLQPFVTSKPSAAGTGLGLSISNDIVKKHGGTLQIRSTEGVETEVFLRFPAATTRPCDTPS